MFKGSTLAINEENTNMAISRNKHIKQILMFIFGLFNTKASFSEIFFAGVFKRTVSLNILTLQSSQIYHLYA